MDSNEKITKSNDNIQQVMQTENLGLASNRNSKRILHSSKNESLKLQWDLKDKVQESEDIAFKHLKFNIKAGARASYSFSSHFVFR